MAVLIWTAFSGSGASSMVPGEALVKLRHGGSKADRQQSASPWTRLGAVTQTALGDSGWKKVTLPEGTDVAAWVRAARSSPDVAAAEPNHRYRLHAVVNDPLAPLQYGLRQIGATSAWATATGSASVVVAVLDTGINAAHPDLAPALWRNPGEVAGNGFDDDGNGVADDVHGADFVDGDGDPADDSGHGSHVAGIIAAAGNNLTGGAGVAYGCRVMALRILSEDGSATTDKIVEAFEYVRAMKRRGVDVRVINNSWGGDFPSLAIFEAVSAAADDGILVVCSAGNEGRDNDGKPMYPTSYVSPGILSVAAGDGCDEPEVYSNVGVRSVHLAAPGGTVYSAYQGSASYASLSGTSMAAPHVSGAAALLLSKRPSLTLAQLRSLLLATVDVVPRWSGLTATGGRLNVARAMDWLNGSTPVPSVPPTNAAPVLPIQLVSRSQSNRLAGASSFTGAYPRCLSDDGRWVVFLSYATNLVAGDTVDNLDVFLRDTWSNTTVRVSQTVAGVGANDDCGAPVISADGAYVAFTSYADNLVSGDGNQSNDVFVWTRSSRALQRISKRPDGSAFDLDSANPSISADGGRVAFSADEDVGGGFSIRDVYVWNRSGNSVQFASLAPGGGFANDWSDSPSISANGRWVAFHSWAGNLVSGDNNGSADVFVRDLNNGSNERVSLDSGGQAGNDDSLYPVISADGRWVAFSSGASNLGLSPGLGQIQTYLYDRDNDRLRPVSKTQAGTVVAGTNYVDSISGDGRFVLFSTAAPGLFPDYGPRLRRPMLFDRLTDALSPLAANHAGFPADDVVFYPQITADGRRVSFSSWANNLVPDDGNNVLDVFVLDRGVAFADLRLRASGATAWTGWGEVGPNLPQRVAQALPGSGSATFDVELVNAGLIATNFVLHATAPNGWGLVVLAGPGAGTNATAAALQGTLSSGTLALGATNTYSLLLTRTSLWADASAAVRLSVRRPGSTEEFDAVQAVVTWSAPPPGYRLASRTSNGTPALLNGEQPSLAADGRLVAFASASENLSPNDGNYQSDIFVWDRQNGSLRPVSTTISGTLGNGDSTRPAFSRNGRHLAFESYSDNLVAGDANDRKDIFVKDLVGGSIQLASVGALGQLATRGSTGAAISGDGRYVLFQSIAPNLVPGDTNGCADVFLKDLQSASIECVSRGPNGVWGNAASAPLQMTPDARFILFSSHATNLGFVDTNQFVDLFLLDRQSGVLSLVSQSAVGVTGSGPGWSASLSDDGRVLVYRADSLGADGTSTGHVVLVDRQTSQRTELGAAALGLPEGFGLFSAKVSPDGRWLALSAGASCGGPSTNHATQLFLHDRVTGATLPASQTRDGRWAEKDLFSATFSGNGRYLAWATPSRTLLAEPWPLSDQVFVFDRANLQSDAAVRRDQQTTWRGDGVESASNAVLEQFLPLDTPRTFFLRITNLTEFAGAVRLTAPTGVAGRWTARYYAENAGGAEITASIASGWEFDPGNAPLDLLVRLEVTVLSDDDLPPLTVQVASVEFPVLVERITLGLSPDSDNDGMADPWERTTFGNLTTATATSDFDQDGALDFAEYQAGTDAKSATSVLRLGLTGWMGTNVSVVLSNTQPSRVYALESGGEVGSGFTGRSSELRGTGTPLTLSVPLLPAETNLFFRVKASLP